KERPGRAPARPRQETRMNIENFGGENQSGHPARDVGRAMWLGFRSRCPHCGEGRLFGVFVKTVDHCEVCDEQISHHRADDLPAYLVILIVGHLVVGAFVGVQMMWQLSTWVHLAIWAPITVIASLLLLQPIKGAMVGLQWALY